MRFQFFFPAILLLSVGRHVLWYSFNGFQYAAQATDLMDLSWNKFENSKKNICKRTANLFSSEDEIKSAIRAADEFHDNGGNLKMIQHFLDDQIEGTFKQLGIKFADRDGLTKPDNMTTSNFIYNLLKENDAHDRGGYDQRSLPGRFEPNHPALFEKRIVNVMESASLDKWEASIGPIGPLCKSIDRIQTRKEKHYEDNSCVLSMI